MPPQRSQHLLRGLNKVSTLITYTLPILLVIFSLTHNPTTRVFAQSTRNSTATATTSTSTPSPTSSPGPLPDTPLCNLTFACTVLSTLYTVRRENIIRTSSNTVCQAFPCTDPNITSQLRNSFCDATEVCPIRLGVKQYALPTSNNYTFSCAASTWEICLTGVRVSSDDPSIIVPADEGRGGLRGVEMAIVIGFIVAAALIVAGAFWFYIRKRMAERNMEKRVLERRQRLREYQQQHEQMHRQLQLQQQQYQMQQQQQQQQVEVDDAFLDRISLTQAETTVQPLGIETVEYLPQYEPDALDVVSADSIVARLFVDADGVGGVDGATDYDSPVRRGEEEHTPGALSSLPRSMRSASEQDGGHLGVEQTATTEISTSATINVNVDVPDDVNEPPSYEAATDLIG